MKAFSYLAAVAFVIALPVFLVTTNIRFLAGEVRFYERGFREHDSVAATGLELDQLDLAAAQMVDYFENDAEVLRIVVIEDGDEVALFGEEEIIHMGDVKRLMTFLFRVNEVSLVVVMAFVAGSVLWSGERTARDLARLSMIGIAVGVVSVGAIGGLAIVSFDETWSRFHEIVFPNDLWQLDPNTDRLIQMYPEPFWQEATYVVGALTLAEATLILVASMGYLLTTRGHPRGGYYHDAPVEAGAFDAEPGDDEDQFMLEQAQPPAPPQQPPPPPEKS